MIDYNLSVSICFGLFLYKLLNAISISLTKVLLEKLLPDFYDKVKKLNNK